MRKFLRSTIFLLASASFFESNAQKTFWTDVKESAFIRTDDQQRTIVPKQSRTFIVDTLLLKSLLLSAPKEFTDEAKANPLILTFPMPDGSTSKFEVVYSPMIEPELEASFPNIKTFQGQGIDDRTAILKMDWTDFGLHVQILSSNNSNSFYIDPYARGEKKQYIAYYKKDLPTTSKVYLEDSVLSREVQNAMRRGNRTASGPCYGNPLKTYRLAIACTGQYAQAIGATTTSQILSQVTTTINRVNGIYERDLAVRMTLVSNETSILFLNQSTPFSANDNNDEYALIDRSQTVIDSVIGVSNYDIGHTFSTGAGGLAYTEVVCYNPLKASGVTGVPLPVGDAYDVDYVAHEIGHQFGGDHTFNASTGSCSGTNRNPATAVEPGSGVTIMAYAGICGINNLSEHSIPFFHSMSQQQIYNYISNTSPGYGGSCPVITNTGNAIPVVNAGANYTIPKSTPFALTGSATDVNNSEVLTYSWEEIDAGIAGNWNSGDMPFFRSFVPSLSPTRYFPKLSDVANGTVTIGEILPSSTQNLNFRLTVRDNRPSGGGVCSADAVVTVDGNTGPFDVTSQASPETWTANGSNQQTITWSVNGTNGAPINCANVSIMFSADGGATFPYTLVASTPNNGSATITVPNIKTTTGRVMVKAVGNIFFDVNTADITINSSCGAVGATITPSSVVTAQVGSSSLNLNLNPTYGSFVPAGAISGSDPYTDLAFLNTSTSSCISSQYNQFQYNLYTFSVTTSGTYTFTFNSGSNGNLVANVYSGFFSNTSVCSNFITSTATYPGSGNVSLNNNMSAALTAGNTYVLVVGTFDNTTALPATYRMTISTTSGGIAYQAGQQYSNPGAGYNYTYVIVNNATGNIGSIGNPDLSNNTTYPSGQYTIYGLSYSTSISNLNSYVGGSFNALANQILNTFCADLSKNAVTVNITGTFPVQLTALKARKQGEAVALDWRTLSEQNSSHFIVQRSSGSSDFTELGRVSSAGTSNSELKYNFIDVTPTKRRNYYRLKQVDLDGSFSYSNVAAVNFDKRHGLMVIYPNPAKDQLNIEYTSEIGGKLELQVLDSKGSVLMSKQIIVSSGGSMKTLNISALSNGLYLLKYIDAEGNVGFSKFIKY